MDEHGVTVKQDQMCYTVTHKNSNTYFPTLDQVFNEILDLKIKEYATADARKTLIGLGESIKQARTEVMAMVRQVTKVSLE